MTWIYEALEMHDRRGKPLGKFRVVRWEHCKPDLLQSLCDHNHGTLDEALECPVVQRVLDLEFSDTPRLPQRKLNS